MYVRKTLAVEDPGVRGVLIRLTEGLNSFGGIYLRGRETVRFEPVVALFCGRALVMYRTPVSETRPEWSDQSAEWVQKTTVSWVYYDTLDAFFGASDLHRWQRRDISTAWERIVRSDCTHVHHALGSPVVIVHAEERRSNIRVEVDSRLKDLSFGRLVGADACYQEIDQFVGGVLSNNPGIVQVSDRDRLLAHGFDPRWSFRNPDPPTRKRKRRKG